MTQMMKLNGPNYKSIRSTVLWHNWIALSMTGWTYLWGNWMNLSLRQFDRPIYDTTGWPLQWLTLLDGPICDRTGLTRLWHNWYVLSLTQLDGPIYNTSGLTNLYICNTNRWLHLQYKNFALYIHDTTGSPLHEINGWPCHWQNWIPRTLLSHLRQKECPVCNTTGLSYIRHKTGLTDD